MHDVIIVGAGPAGLSAALLLGRCRRRVLVCDAGQPRNAAATALHGFLTRDGIPPAELLRIGREQLARYDSVEIRDVTVTEARRVGPYFDVVLDDGGRLSARKLLLATGVRDILPQIEGVLPLYGRSVFHCPYCDGWEHRDEPLAVYGKGKGGKGMFGVDQYYLAIFGKPHATEPWMVQFGGHHLGVNVTVIGKHFVLTPTHTGTQPAVFKRDGKEVRPLFLVERVHELEPDVVLRAERAQAIIADRPQGELLLGPGRDGKKIEPKGVKGSTLTAGQQALLLDLIGAWVHIAEPDTAARRMAEIKAKVGETYFAWSGPTEPGSAVYFRVQGPTVVIEYAPQGSTDHIHTVIRNPEDDYGAAHLKQ